MGNLRLFIAGHVIGLSETERAEERKKMTNQAEFFEDIGFDIVNPIELLDDNSDPKFVMWNYVHMMLDCTHILLFSDSIACKECQIARNVASAYGVHELVIEPDKYTHERNAPKVEIIAKIATAIQEQTGVQFTEYTKPNREELAIKAKAMFVHFCVSEHVSKDEIARNLKFGCSEKQFAQEIKRNLMRYDSWCDDFEFNDDVTTIRGKIHHE